MKYDLWKLLLMSVIAILIGGLMLAQHCLGNEPDSAAPPYDQDKITQMEVKQPAQTDTAKRAVVYVSPGISKTQKLMTKKVVDDEMAYLLSLGYQVTVKEGTTQAIVEDIYQGVSAIAFFGHGGFKDETGNRHPTIASLDSQTWKKTIKERFTSGYMQDENLSFKEAALKAEARSENFGLDLVRNFSCFGLYDHSLAYRFVKPGGYYHGAKRWASPTVTGQAISNMMTVCSVGGICECVSDAVSKFSAAHLTPYRVLEKPSEGVGISDANCKARAGHLARVVKDWSTNGRRAVYDSKAFWKTMGGDEGAARVRLLQYLKNKDGVEAPIRTGRETAFYNRLKEELRSQKKNGSLGMDEILRIGLDANTKTDGTANLQETFLTIHNVMRLLARPQQWSGQTAEDYGHRSTDPAWPIIQDISGARSSGGESLPDILDIQKADNGTPWDPYWSMRSLFDPEDGVFQPQPGAVNAEWNAGSHYYYWIGALEHSTLGSAAVMAGAYGETLAKQSQDKGEQGAVQVSYLICGSKFAAEIYKDRQEYSVPSPPPPLNNNCEALNPAGKGLEKGQFYIAYNKYVECLKGYQSSSEITPPPPAISDDPKKACIDCVNALITGPCYVRMATLAGWGLCLTCDKDGGVDPKDRFIEKTRCPMCAEANWNLCDFKPAPKNCVPSCCPAPENHKK